MKPIPQSNNLYAITESGFVININTGRVLRQYISRRGYPSLHINKFGAFSVHRLVAEAFIPNPENKPTVNHINGIKTDNRVENLEWATLSENHKHAYKNGLSKRLKAKLKESEVKEIRELLAQKISSSVIMSKYNITSRHLTKIRNNKIWKDI